VEAIFREQLRPWFFVASHHWLVNIDKEKLLI
jgi:hypothetical protein